MGVGVGMGVGGILSTDVVMETSLVEGTFTITIR